jgi:hypothetical protein
MGRDWPVMSATLPYRIMEGEARGLDSTDRVAHHSDRIPEVDARLIFILLSRGIGNLALHWSARGFALSEKGAPFTARQRELYCGHRGTWLATRMSPTLRA